MLDLWSVNLAAPVTLIARREKKTNSAVWPGSACRRVLPIVKSTSIRDANLLSEIKESFRMGKHSKKHSQNTVTHPKIAEIRGKDNRKTQYCVGKNTVLC